MLHWIIDIILLLILLGCAWKGFRNGLIPGLFMLLALFASLYGAKLVAETYSEEFISILEPFASGVTDRAIREMDEDKKDTTGTVYGEAYALTLTIAFTLLAIAFAVIGNLISLSFHIPGLELVNSILGAILGIGEGLVFCFFIAWVLRFAGMLVKPEVVEETRLLSWLTELNPLVDFFGL